MLEEIHKSIKNLGFYVYLVFQIQGVKNKPSILKFLI